MAQWIPRITSEEMSTQPFRCRPGDGEHNQATVSGGKARPAIDHAARDPRRKAGEESQDGGETGDDRWPQQGEVGGRHVEGFEDPVGADGEMTDAPHEAAPE